VFPVRYELSYFIPEDGILHSHSSENLKSYDDVLVCLAFTFQLGAVIVGFARYKRNRVIYVIFHRGTRHIGKGRFGHH
jgi:hypothetical protein